MATEVSSSDRDWLNKTDELADLVRHPAWKVYESEVLDVVLTDLKNMLLDDKTNDIGVVQGIRLAMKAIVKLRSRPEELINMARSFRADFGLAPPEEK